MSSEEFIEKIIEAYVNARNLTFGNGGYDLRRGMSHSSSGPAEDLFGLYIAKFLDRQDLIFLVDKVISVRVPGDKKVTSLKPDLAIISDGVLIGYFDLKMDLGWNRHIQPYLLDKVKLVNKLKGNTAWYKREGNKVSLKVSDSLIYQMVVLSGHNINKDLLASHSLFCTEQQDLKFYVLTSGVHLNIYREEERENINIHTEEFDRLKQDTLALL